MKMKKLFEALRSDKSRDMWSLKSRKYIMSNNIDGNYDIVNVFSDKYMYLHNSVK